jgi:5,10-methylenetetrahydrofolate reductase
MIANVPGIKTPESVMQRIKGVQEAAIPEESFKIALEVAQATRPFVRGFHVVSGGSPLLAIQLCNRLVSWIDSF